MSVLYDIIGKNKIPKMVRAIQNFPRPRVEDVPAAVRKAVEEAGVLDRIKVDNTVAISGGSRGIDNMDVIIRELVSIVKERGGKPFIFPAMGSHGGATPEGQRDLLYHLGITEELCGCPIVSSMETDMIGFTEKTHLPVYIDHNANQADAIILTNRIKLHTSFRGPVESGLSKMAVIGMGKQKGAELCHNRGWLMMKDSLMEIADHIFNNAKVIFGVGTLENGYDETAEIVCFKGEEILQREPAALDKARGYMPEIPFRNYDVLIVDIMGKEYSGAGIDTNIISRYPSEAIPPDPRQRIVTVLNLSDKSMGNTIGLGMADVTTLRLFNKWDREATYVNTLTNCTMHNFKMPLVMDTDKMAVLASLQFCRLPDSTQAKVVRIRSTLEVSDMLISEALIEEAKKIPHIEIVGNPEEMAFNNEDNLF